MSLFKSPLFKLLFWSNFALTLLSNLWEILIFWFVPAETRVVTGLATLFSGHPKTAEGILFTVSLTIFSILIAPLLLTWLLRTMGLNEDRLKDQVTWHWFLGGSILSLLELQQSIGRFWLNAFWLLLLGVVGYLLYRRNKSQAQV